MYVRLTNDRSRDFKRNNARAKKPPEVRYTDRCMQHGVILYGWPVTEIPAIAGETRVKRSKRRRAEGKRLRRA